MEFGSHYARGMLSIRNGGYTALLSYDKASRLAQMQVSLNVQAVPPRYMPALFYVQGRTRVARIILEPDGRGAVVQVSSLYLDPSHAGIVVGLMVLDLQALLRDDRLVSILGIGRDNGSHKVREGGAS